MPRGGARNTKPIALHKLHGTFRKDRHGPGERLEARIVSLEYNHCSFCDHRFGPVERYIGNAAETVFICAGCLREAIDMLDIRRETAPGEDTDDA